MQPAFKCSDEQLTNWWKPIASLGYEVLLFEEGDRAMKVARRVLGPVMWEDGLVRDDLGGIVVSEDEDSFVWVSIHAGPRRAHDLPPGTYELSFGLIPPKKLRRSRKERRMLTDVRRVLLERGLTELETQ